MSSANLEFTRVEVDRRSGGGGGAGRQACRYAGIQAAARVTTRIIILIYELTGLTLYNIIFKRRATFNTLPRDIRSMTGW